MRPPCVLIVSHLFEPSVDEVVNRLTERGVEWHRFNVEEYPLLVRSTFSTAADLERAGGLSLNSHHLPSADVTAVWFRRATKSALPAYMQEKDRAFAQDEAASFLNGLFDCFDSRWINNRDAERRYSNKINQLKLAKIVGFDIPDTVITNDKASVLEFARRRGELVFKPLSGYSPRASDFTDHAQGRFAGFGPVHIASHEVEHELEVTFTQVLTPDKLESLDSLSLSPAIFQEFILKKSDLRVTVVGDKIFPCKIHSQANSATAVDFRRLAFLPPGEEIYHEKIELSAELRGNIIEYMRRSGLQFGCFDFVERPSGSFAFLEVNPSGQWLWVERLTGMSISDAVADLLVDDAEPPSSKQADQ